MNRYQVQLAAALAVYITLLVGAFALLLGLPHASASLRAGIALSPMLPAVAMCLLAVKQIRAADELQARIQLEGIAFAFALTALGTFSYGFLHTVRAPSLSWFFVWPFMALTWIVGVQIAKRRYQ